MGRNLSICWNLSEIYHPIAIQCVRSFRILFPVCLLKRQKICIYLFIIYRVFIFFFRCSYFGDTQNCKLEARLENIIATLQNIVVGIQCCLKMFSLFLSNEFYVSSSSKFASGHYSIGGDGDPGGLVVEHCKKHLRKIALLNPEGTVRKRVGLLLICPQLLLFTNNFSKQIMYVQVWSLQYMRSENFQLGEKFWIIRDPAMQPCFCAYNTGLNCYNFAVVHSHVHSVRCVWYRYLINTGTKLWIFKIIWTDVRYF
jgi:hypothetical protein